MPLIRRDAPQQQAQQRRLPRPVGSGDRDAVAVVESRVDGAEREAAPAHDGSAGPGHDVAGARRGGDRQLQDPLLAGLVDHLEALDHPVGLGGLRGLFLAGPSGVGADVLVPLHAASLGLAHRGLGALVHPGALHPRACLQCAAAPGVVLVGLARVAPPDGALLEVGVVAAAVDDDPLQGAVDLDDRGGGVRQQLAVVADHEHRRARVGDEALQEVQPCGIEVVARLVQEVGVIA